MLDLGIFGLGIWWELDATTEESRAYSEMLSWILGFLALSCSYFSHSLYESIALLRYVTNLFTRNIFYWWLLCCQDLVYVVPWCGEVYYISGECWFGWGRDSFRLSIEMLVLEILQPPCVFRTVQLSERLTAWSPFHDSIEPIEHHLPWGLRGTRGSYDMRVSDGGWFDV